MSRSEKRVYPRCDVVSFRSTKERFGGLSNMAPGFPIILQSHNIRTAEALYQSCRFPHLPEIQQLILNERSPMTAKMRCKPFRDKSRSDWDEVRVPIMKWCLRVKLACNWSKFSGLLLETGERSIVEDSRKDDFWGAKAIDDFFQGQNVLGRLLMDLREKIKTSPETLQRVGPLSIPDFKLLGEGIPYIEAHLPAKQYIRSFASDVLEHASFRKQVTISLDADVFRYFCENESNWEDRINEALRQSIKYTLA